MAQSLRFMDVEVANVSKLGAKIFTAHPPKLNINYPNYFAATSKWARELENDRGQDRVRKSSRA